MPNRILKESILDSPTLARLSEFSQDQFPRLLLLADDWGCFNADPETIKGRAYSKRPRVSPKVVGTVLKEFNSEGMLFLWYDKDRIFGFWTGWQDHNWCNTSAVTSDGKQDKHRRKTPEPPVDQLTQYLTEHQNRLEQVRTNTLIPIPIPIPIPNPLFAPTERVEEAAAAVTPDLMLEIYNRERGTLPECKKLSDDRRQKCRARIRERRGDQDGFVRDWTSAVTRARASPFCCGQGERQWWLTFDWLIKNGSSYLKVLEGKYDGTHSGNEPTGRKETTGSAGKSVYPPYTPKQ